MVGKLSGIVAKLMKPFAASMLLALAAGSALAQEAAGWTSQPLTAAHWLVLVGVFVALWLILYFILYPYFLRFVSPGDAKVWFWSLFVFYAITWIHLSSYLIFDVGFYYSWVRGVAAVLSGLWLLWFVGVTIRGLRA